MHAALAEVRARAALMNRSTRGGAAALVLVDGRSGSGKTTFAAGLAAATGARLLRLDDVYPGWDGLDAAAAAVLRGVLVPRAAGLAGRLRRWDWSADRAAAELVVPADRPLVVEGCGALTRGAARLADLRVWVELDAVSRRARALQRDGAAFAPHWQRWAGQETRFIARERPRAHADLVIDGRTVRRPPSERTAGTHYPRAS